MTPELRSWWRFKIKPFFKWFDLWIGLFIDLEEQAIYICPCPMIGVKIMWWKETLADASYYAGWNEALNYLDVLYTYKDKDYLTALAMSRKITER